MCIATASSLRAEPENQKDAGILIRASHNCSADPCRWELGLRTAQTPNLTGSFQNPSPRSLMFSTYAKAVIYQDPCFHSDS